ncbi:MAG: peptidase MA family metallohydrolase [Pirellulales bacterium]
MHSSDEGYAREVGAAGKSTVASALVERQRGAVARRRIDVRATRADWQTRALGHELTHIVLADRFANAVLPRWVDEGIAILADTHEKQHRHSRDLATALSVRAEFRVLELFALDEYPPADRWATFYGQSASLVRFLVEHAGEQQFLEFVEVSLEQGYEQGLQTAYGLGAQELESRWRAHAHRTLAAEAAGELAQNDTRPAALNTPQPARATVGL